MPPGDADIDDAHTGAETADADPGTIARRRTTGTGMKRVSIALGAAFGVIGCAGLVGCGSGDEAAITISDPWARATAPSQPSGVVYFTIEAADDDTLLSVSVPASVAGSAAIHEAVVADGGTSADASADDAMAEMLMREVTEGVALPAGELVDFGPGLYHVMLDDLAQPLVDGTQFELTLDFARAATEMVTVDVAESAP